MKACNTNSASSVYLRCPYRMLRYRCVALLDVLLVRLRGLLAAASVSILNANWYKPLALTLLTAHCLLFTASDAHAMHISEGILPLHWAVLWFAVATPFVAYGLYRLRKLSSTDLSFKPLVGLMAAAVFIISCMPIPVPTAGTCSHPCGTGMSGILLGPAISVLVASVALLIQALFLSHGGLSTLGGNIVSMGVMGSYVGYLTFRALRGFKVSIAMAAFVAGLFADWATYMTTSVELAAGIKGDSPFMPLFWKLLIAFVPTQLPLGVLEGAMTAGVIVLLYRRRPDLLVKMRVIKQEEPTRSQGPGWESGKMWIFILVILSLFISPFTYVSASEKWQGVDETVVERVAKEHGREPMKPLINTDQGDLLLFLFLIAGTVGGFAMGYYWRILTERKPENRK